MSGEKAMTDEATKLADSEKCPKSPDGRHKYECVYEGESHETYKCAWCGDRYKLYDDEMR